MKKLILVAVAALSFSATVAGQEKFSREALIVQNEEISCRWIIIPPTRLFHIGYLNADAKFGMMIDKTTPLHFAGGFVNTGLVYLVTRDMKTSVLCSIFRNVGMELSDSVGSDQGADIADFLFDVFGTLLFMSIAK